jgi:hypothetical protein
LIHPLRSSTREKASLRADTYFKMVYKYMWIARICKCTYHAEKSINVRPLMRLNWRIVYN